MPKSRNIKSSDMTQAKCSCECSSTTGCKAWLFIKGKSSLAWISYTHLKMLDTLRGSPLCHGLFYIFASEIIDFKTG